MIPINRKIQAAAHLILRSQAWEKETIEAALNPTAKQAEDRGMLPVADVNPEQHSAIKLLHSLGWGSHAIAQAMPVNEADIARVISLDWENGLKI